MKTGFQGHFNLETPTITETASHCQCQLSTAG